MARKRRMKKWIAQQPPWLKAGVICLIPLVLLNVSVAFFGRTVVSPLSPFFLREKVHALGKYFRHRVVCVFRSHPDLDPIIRHAEKRHHIPSGLLQALIAVESEGRVHRISFAGAMGPAQLMPDTARMLAVGDPFDSEAAVDASARYLSTQLRDLGAMRLAVAAYNAGPGNVRGVVPRNGETEYYVEKVMRMYARLRPASTKPR
jgi:Transglycosylase SLT domain